LGAGSLELGDEGIGGRGDWGTLESYPLPSTLYPLKPKA
jgi:hypothetical protein